jgi:sugar phosphate isomerase/epimerase
MQNSRREFIKSAAGLTALGLLPMDILASTLVKEKNMKLGLCTYLWGKDWDLPTLLKNCEKADVLGVELRVEHAHKVEPDLSPSARQEVKKKFADSPVKFVGCGTNGQYDFPDKEKLNKAIESTKAYIKLSHDCGGSGVKVKPNAFHKDVPHEKTIEQIGQSLNELGKFAADYGQQIRLEVHGNETQELPNIKAIMDVATNKNVTVCWNSNAEDLLGNGLEYNFNLVKNRFGDTVHVRELNIGDYPYQQLMTLFVKMKYKGWILLECRTEPSDIVAAMIEQKKIFDQMVATGSKS